MPAAGVYLQDFPPFVIASAAACRMAIGVSKSGSPAVNAQTSTPSAFISAAFSDSANVTDGVMLDTALDIWTFISASCDPYVLS